MRPTLAKLPILTLALAALLGFSRSACGVGIDPKSLPGVVVDDADAQLTGEWKQSIHVSPFVGTGYLTDNDSDKGEKSVRFVPQLPKAGRYHVLIAYTSGVTPPPPCQSPCIAPTATKRFSSTSASSRPARPPFGCWAHSGLRRPRRVGDHQHPRHPWLRDCRRRAVSVGR